MIITSIISILFLINHWYMIRFLLSFSIVYLAISSCSFLSAQNRLSGRLTDSLTKTPLVGATIIDQANSDNVVVTDENGIFIIENINYPLEIKLNYIGYKAKVIRYNDKPVSPPIIQLSEDEQLLESVLIKGQRVSEKQKADPKSVEIMDLLAIKESPSISFYNSLGNLKGVDMTTASLGFTIINTRGFNSTSPVRSLQLIDGMDNQAPGLNFSLGNFLGVSELDILKVDVISGASSTLFGPNAFNGVINMETKSPFYHKGLSVSLKVGERQLWEGAIRWADVIKNKKGHDFLGYKVNLFHLRAYDWEAENYEPVYDTPLAKDNIGGYDAVNIYGDEYQAGQKNSNLRSYKGLESWSRKGYQEKDLVDYNTRNTKGNGVLYFRTNPSKGQDSPELILGASFGSGTTVYQGENRFSLRDIFFLQNKIEFRKEKKFYIRAYSTNEDAGKSYDPYFTALQLQQASKSERQYISDFFTYWGSKLNPIITETGYPKPDTIGFDPIFGYKTAISREKFEIWKAEHLDSLAEWYSRAKNYADNNISPFDNGVPFYEPGTARFKDKFNEIISNKSNNKSTLGTRFFDKSALYHLQGEYTFNPAFAEIKVGGSGRLYRPNSEGTIFYDTAGVRITSYEYGIFTGLEKKFYDNKFTLNAAIRADKNKNFDWLFSPAASIVYNPAKNTFFRLSFSSAIRNPTLTDQYLSLNVGPATLVGNLYGVDSVITVSSFRNYLDSFNVSNIRYFNIDAIRPEKVKSLEVGVRTTLFSQLYVDAGYYFSFYKDFIGYNLGIKSKFDALGFPEDVRVYRYSANSSNRVTTQGFNIGLNYYFANYFMLSGNYSWNKLNKENEDDPIIPGFNTPEHKYNIGISARDLSIQFGAKEIKNLGFNIVYKWIQGFIFEGSPQFTGYIPDYDLIDAQLSIGFIRFNTTLKIGASNLLNNRIYQTYGGPKVGRMAYISLLYNLVK